MEHTEGIGAKVADMESAETVTEVVEKDNTEGVSAKTLSVSSDEYYIKPSGGKVTILNEWSHTKCAGLLTCFCHFSCIRKRRQDESQNW